MSKLETFAINMPTDPNSEEMDKFQEAMNKWQEEMAKYGQQIEEQFEVSSNCALNIIYLRSRGRWTQELENELIRIDKVGEPQPNMCEWPPKDYANHSSSRQGTDHNTQSDKQSEAMLKAGVK